MIILSLLWAAWMTVLVAIQGLVVRRFVAVMRAFRRKDCSDQSLPSAAVVLALRGPDPHLSETLQALLQQDHPHFEVRIVADGEIEGLRAFMESTAHGSAAPTMTLEPLRERLDTCTLKCSALRQVLPDLLSRHEVIAFIDGDVVPHDQWLRDLVTPLSDPTIGASTGNRWYAPCQANWGSLVRYYWNAGAISQMWLNNMVWGGSMALRSDVIRRIDLLSAWSRALSDDSTISHELRRHGYRVQFVPGTVALNPERISLSRCLLWIQRQLVTAQASRLGWCVILTHGLLLTATQLISGGLAVAGLLKAQPLVTAISGLSLLGFWSANFALAASLDGSVQRIVRLNGGGDRGARSFHPVRQFAALLLTLMVYPITLLKAAFCRRVFWRGIEYEIVGHNRVKMVAYRPFSAPSQPESMSSVV